MCEVTRFNFFELYPSVIKNIETCSFIAIDAEFSGLYPYQQYVPSLFDSTTERYSKLRKNLENVEIIQFGISTFHFDRETQNFTSTPYNFYIFPAASPVSDGLVLCQSSSIEFLSTVNFDFNKVFHEGVSYLNKKQEAQLRKYLTNGEIHKRLLESINIPGEESLSESCQEIVNWASKAEVNDSFYFPLKITTAVYSYLLQKEIRHRFPSLWTTSNGKCIKVTKVANRIIHNFAGDLTDPSLDEQVFDALLGFSKVIQKIIELKKPLVGHNCLLDLLLLYKQFLGPLPKSYQNFKSSITHVFPNVYDTKFLSFELQKRFKDEKINHINSLKSLYVFLKKEKGNLMSTHAPTVNVKNGFTLKEDSFHDAGYDSLCTGYCFIRLAHIFSSRNGNYPHKMHKLTYTELFAGVSSFNNHINMVKCNVECIVLSGKDPPCTTPRLLHLESKKFSSINLNLVAKQCSRFGNIDIMPYTRTRALLATTNYKSAHNILKFFENHEDIRASWYSTLRHSKNVRRLMWGGAILSSAMCAVFFLKTVSKFESILKQFKG